MGEGEGEGEGRSVGELEVELTDLYKKKWTHRLFYMRL